MDVQNTCLRREARLKAQLHNTIEPTQKEFVDLELESVVDGKEELEYDFCIGLEMNRDIGIDMGFKSAENKQNVSMAIDQMSEHNRGDIKIYETKPSISSPLSSELTASVYNQYKSLKTKVSRIQKKFSSSSVSEEPFLQVEETSSRPAFREEIQEFEEDDDEWMSVEKDLSGNLHVSLLDNYIPPLRLNSEYECTACVTAVESNASVRELQEVEDAVERDFEENATEYERGCATGDSTGELDARSSRTADQEKCLVDTSTCEEKKRCEQDEVKRCHHSSASAHAINQNDGWDVLHEDYSIILKNDKKGLRKLDRFSRAQALVVGLSSVALSTVLFSMFPVFGGSLVGNFLLLNSADLIKLGYKGRSSKLILDQKVLTIPSLLQELASKNCKLSVISYSATTASKALLYSLFTTTTVISSTFFPIPAVMILDQFDFSAFGLEIHPFELTEKAIVGAVSSATSELLKDRSLSKSRNEGGNGDDGIEDTAKTKQKKKKKKKRKRGGKTIVKKAMMGSVSGVAGGMIGPFVSSPVAEKYVLEACSAGAKLTEQFVTRS